MVQANITVLPGDGIGPEVTAGGVEVLKAVAAAAGHEFAFTECDFGGISIDNHGEPLTPETLAACEKADAILLGAVGGPKWHGGAKRPEQGLLAIRKALGLFANIRPCVIVAPEVAARVSPLRPERLKGCDFVVVRELTGGIYFGERQEAGEDGIARDTMVYSVGEIERIARCAGNVALTRRKKVLSVDKSNVLACSRLWRKTVERIFKDEFPTVTLEHMLVDSAAMHMLRAPADFDVMVTANMFGDILTDEASMLPGSLGLLPSASLSESGKGIFEPIHGSAPDIAGKGIANPVGTILSAAMLLRHALNLHDEAKIVERAVRQVLAEGVGTADIVPPGSPTSSTAEVSSAIAARVTKLFSEPRPMTLSEKILCHNAIGLAKPEVKPGDVVSVKVQWTIASEITWKGMEKTYDEIGRPGVHRNDRFWLAIDHTVDPRIYDQPKPKALIAASERIADEVGLVDFHAANQTILHTEFVRQRVKPGQIVCGADSHSCSGGCMGSWSVGLGAADVMMPTVTGETWLEVPPTLKIKYVGELPFGIGGKDVILYTMGELKRNTVAFERAVEYTGNLSQLSIDARFAIANMTAEFGGIVGLFEADEHTASYMRKRSRPKDRTGGLFFRADPDAEYAAEYELDLGKVDSLVALYPSPDHVVPVDSVAGKKLDGVFIGACTTGEEDLILAAVVLRVAMAQGLRPLAQGQRRVTPGSVPIVAKLRKLGLADVYESAGFTIGAPGCSYCLGIAADVAGEGEVWLSSQNRNFRNRMGKGSIGNLASAATVAASSFMMEIANPRKFLDLIDQDEYRTMLDKFLQPGDVFEVAVPRPTLVDPTAPALSVDASAAALPDTLSGRAQVFEDHIDTDAIIPAQFMPGKDDDDLGTHCFEFVAPEFREKVKAGGNIVVAGVGFGSGSSREEAVRALKGAGVIAVIAKSYAFIYGRNQSNLGLLGIRLPDPEFHALAVDGAEISIDIKGRTVTVAGKTFPFKLSDVEERLLQGGGVVKLFKEHRKNLFRAVVGAPAGDSGGCGGGSEAAAGGGGCGTGGDDLDW
eukprot:m.42818 g.42818  ORF g.42818 m.42818 type:complete len:1045 (-) comp11584_c0_seq3:583-3717(-)